jgi:hypothetical protein
MQSDMNLCVPPLTSLETKKRDLRYTKSLSPNFVFVFHFTFDSDAALLVSPLLARSGICNIANVTDIIWHVPCLVFAGTDAHTAHRLLVRKA